MPDVRYPVADRLDVVDDLHGHPVPDPYRWLEDPESTDTKEWSEAQDALFAEVAASWPSRPWFARTIRELLGAGATSAPLWRGTRRFFVRREPEQEHGVLYVVDGDGPERALVDPMALDPHGTTTLDSWRPDKSGRLLAYQLSAGGDEESLLRVVDIETGETVDGPIDRCRNSPLAWLPDGTAFYYVRRLAPELVPEGEEQFHRRVYLHRVGTSPDTDVLVFGAGRDKTEYFGVGLSRDGRWLVLTAARGTDSRNDAWIADLSRTGPETPELTPVQEDVDAEVSPQVGRDGRLYLFTDRDAPRGRLCVADPRHPDYAHWRTLIPEDPDAVLTDYALLDGPELGDRPVLLVERRRHAISEISVHDPESGEARGEVPLPGLGSIGALMVRPEGGHEAWFRYTDHTSPVRVYRYDARDGAVTPWADAPGAVTPPPVRAEQVTYTSADGTPVRMLVISPPESTGPRPTILYGYGGFSISLAPAYSATALAWVRAGGVYAVANLRGGAEEGEEWHRAGMRADKQNVFDDCHAAADHLIDTGVTTPEQLAVMGGSNGGLLVGAVVTQRPHRFAAAVCSAPLLDMVRYERFGLGPLWHGEFGTAEDPEQLGWLLSYSPYHNVAEGARYPAVLFTVFDNDTRVDPLHARKMCAAMQHASGSDATERPVLLRRESDVGHAARSLSRSVALAADQLAFVARQTGMRV